MSEQSAAAGWYRDATGVLRWWDGTAWTAHVAPEPAPVPVASTPVPAAAVAVAGMPMSARTFLPEAAASHQVSDSMVPSSPHRSAAVLDGYARSTGPVLGGPLPQRDVGQGLLQVVVGLVCIGACYLTFQLASLQGGLVWTGGAIFGVVLVLRGIGAMLVPGSGAQQRMASAAVTAADPYAAHRAAKQAAALGPRRQRFVPGWVVVACLVGTAALVFAIVAWPTGSPNSVASTPTRAVAPRTTTAAKPATAAKAKAARAKAAKATAAKRPAAPRDVGPWVPHDPAHSWTSVGTTYAYSDAGTVQADCAPGTSCVRLLVASKHACSALRVRVLFLRGTGAGGSTSASVVVHHVRAGKPMAVIPSVQGYTTSAVFSSLRCL